MRDIIIYTDGSCLHNPGRGGWAAVVIDGENRYELSGGVVLSTNNRMEIRAAIQALRSLDISDSTNMNIKIYSDSQLLVNSIQQGWAVRWRANNWKRNKKDKAENPDLWAELLPEIEQRNVEFVWIRAHVGTAENERCDVLAKAAAEQATEHDTVYEQTYAQHAAEQSATQTTEQTTLFAEPAADNSAYIVRYHKGTSTIHIQHATNGTLRIPKNRIMEVINAIKDSMASA